MQFDPSLYGQAPTPGLAAAPPMPSDEAMAMQLGNGPAAIGPSAALPGGPSTAAQIGASPFANRGPLPVPGVPGPPLGVSAPGLTAPQAHNIAGFYQGGMKGPSPTDLPDMQRNSYTAASAQGPAASPWSSLFSGFAKGLGAAGATLSPQTAGLAGAAQPKPPPMPGQQPMQPPRPPGLVAAPGQQVVSPAAPMPPGGQPNAAPPPMPGLRQLGNQPPRPMGT
jgi:hypothetical protein